MRRRTRADANQVSIDITLRALGASVLPLGDVGKGCPDRLVGFRGKNYLIETKNREREKTQSIAQRENLMRTPDQTRFHAEWHGQVAVAYTPEDAMQIIGANSPNRAIVRSPEQKLRDAARTLKSVVANLEEDAA